MAVSHRGAISFGLVHIPVGLYTTTQDNDIHFNQLCREDGSKVQKGLRILRKGDLIKGYRKRL